MIKSIRSILLTFGVIVIITGCSSLSKAERQELYVKAIPIGQEYFKKYYDADVEFEGYEIKVPMSSTIVLNGHIKDDPQTWVTLSFYLPSLEIKSEG
ncbi:hypothetical protein J2W91_004137 [Paenibacillus amylolyticus]|uniref:Lipoprotein n=1 Tax=Paenibacillus amylolyticus TaxID=1451 RepID=A0AAP5H5K3_PAEAM|nr:hypothetical protein [Paenibacillus amylolyticus]MDR6725635.1 hypothetical protein [Paenibacillus amylolyticus]